MPAPAGGAVQAASEAPSHNLGASSSAKKVTASSSLLAIPAVPSVVSTTELTPSLFPTPLQSTTAATVPSAVNPFSPSSPPPTARSFGQSLLVSLDQVLRPPTAGRADDVDDSDTTGPAVDDKEQELEQAQAPRFIKIVEKPGAVTPTNDPEQRPEPPKGADPGAVPTRRECRICTRNPGLPPADRIDRGRVISTRERTEGAGLVVRFLRRPRGIHSRHGGSAVGAPGSQRISGAGSREKINRGWPARSIRYIRKEGRDHHLGLPGQARSCAMGRLIEEEGARRRGQSHAGGGSLLLPGRGGARDRGGRRRPRGASTLKERLPDLIVTDLQMPRMDGLALVEAVRSDHPSVPVVLITAHGSEDIAAKARSGAASYVPKRHLAQDLAAVVTHIIAMAAPNLDRRRSSIASRRPVSDSPSTMTIRCSRP